MTDSKYYREVKSYVKREGRMTVKQKKAMRLLWPKFGLELASSSQDLTEIFGREAERVFEIGFGMGHSLLQLATEHPETDYIGVEVHSPGVGAVLAGMHEHDLTNIRIFKEDAKLVLQQCIADESLDKILIYFPDPWHKKKHHKRRLIQTDFVQLLRAKLKPGGVLHMATDWENYAEQMLEVLSAAPGWQNEAGERCYAQQEGLRPETKFERRGRRLGHGVWDLLFKKVAQILNCTDS